MRETSFYNEALQTDQFKIDYPYYGLFGSATITPIHEADEVVYRCRLLNGTTIFLKKLFQSTKWIDAGVNDETPLAKIIGLSIDDFLKIKKGV
ncbi:MAG: hypothetical protein J7502_17695 [Flavisolibacter sp.]|nr:hypothetical protein [Flavisolibacter sp.]